MYESIQDLKTDLHVQLIFVKQAEAGTSKVRKRASYERLDEQLQQLVTNFHLYPRNEFFKRARVLFNF